MRLTETLNAIKNYPSENQRKVKYTHINLEDNKIREIIKNVRKKHRLLRIY